MDNERKSIVIGMSGGVDSSVAAYLLKQQGHNLIGVFMNNWEETDEDNGACTAQSDYQDAKSVCLKLDIPFYTVNFAKEYWDNVFTHFLEEYKKGRTPNPDIMCNSEIKFKCFLNYARDTFGADYIATGHYVRNRIDEYGNGHLLKGLDPNKDQSYFLSALTSQQVAGGLFPVGDMLKPDVRKIASELGLRTADKKDSTGVCFIGERNFTKFLKQYIPAQPGDIVDADSKKVIGKHDGLMYYTIAQRRGLGIGNMGGGERWYVCEKDLSENILYVCEGAENPKLFKQGFISNEVHLINPLEQDTLKCKVKYRYRQTEREATVHFTENGAEVIFDEKQSGIAPGQSGVFYVGDECIGSAVIDEVIEN